MSAFFIEFYKKNKFYAYLLSLLVIVFSLTACDLAHNYTQTDRAAGLDVQDYRDGLAPRLPETSESGAAKGPSQVGIPSLQSYIATPGENYRAMPLVSISVNQTVPLKDVLYELARQADYDIELDPNIVGSIIFTARERPLDQVIERICEVAGLRHSFENGVLRVENDLPYVKTYKIDFLTFVRSNSSSVSNNISVVSGEGADTGSQFTTSSESEADFWGELTTNLTQILEADRIQLKTKTNPALQASRAASPQASEFEGDGAVLNVESLPVENPNIGAGPATSEEEIQAPDAGFSVNRQAGLVSVFASERTHKEVQSYIQQVKRSVTAQVLIEAKILEVTLTDEYVAGINWDLVDNTLGGDLVDLSFTSPFTITSDSVINTTSQTVFSYAGEDISGMIRAISGFGTVRALASPRLTVLNNQAAVLNVADNVVYFELEGDREEDDDTGDVTINVDSTIKSVPEGVLMNVLPSINLDNNTVTMAIRPTVTRVLGFEEDPAFTLIASLSATTANLRSNIPELNIQEIDTLVTVPSGNVVVMGGLLTDRISNTENAVPVLGEVPIMGNLFKSSQDRIKKTELVILLQATIAHQPSDTISKTDKDVYRRFSGDRRPFHL